MANKKLVADLGSAVNYLAVNVEKLTVKMEEFNGLLCMIQRKVQGVEEFVGRVVFPSEELAALTGELRAFRHLWDESGKFKFMDKPQMSRVGDGSKGEKKG